MPSIRTADTIDRLSVKVGRTRADLSRNAQVPAT
jgi:hypothetical protein